MRKVVYRLFFIGIIALCNNVYSQSAVENIKGIEINFCDYTISMLNGEYRNAINQILKNKVLTSDQSYNLSCCYMRINNVDSSFITLNSYLNNYHIDPFFAGDVTFYKLWNYSEWNILIENAKNKYKTENQNLLLPALEFELQKFKGEDQSTILSDTILFTLFHKKHIQFLIKEVEGCKVINQISKNGLEAILLFVMHDQNLQFQKRYYKILRKLAKRDMVSLELVCTLYDKILQKSCGKQLYGTQWYYDKTSCKSMPYPIRNIKNIEKRRKSKNFDFSFKQYSDFQNISTIK